MQRQKPYNLVAENYLGRYQLQYTFLDVYNIKMLCLFPIAPYVKQGSKGVSH